MLDFRLNFASIQGTPLYSRVKLKSLNQPLNFPGATDCVIYNYRSKADTTASWQAVMYKGDDYKEASKIYENVFKQVKKSRIRWIDKSIVGFAGEMEKPSEALRFTVSTLQFALKINDIKTSRQMLSCLQITADGKFI